MRLMTPWHMWFVVRTHYRLRRARKRNKIAIIKTALWLQGFPCGDRDDPLNDPKINSAAKRLYNKWKKEGRV